MESSLVNLIILLVACARVAISQSDCGTADSCTTLYNEACPEDGSSQLSCMQSQQSCDQPIESPTNASVQCYSTCIEGSFINPAIPSRCCADPILDENIARTDDPSYVILRIYAPNMPNDNVYRHNTLCSYNLQCPSSFLLYHTLVRYDIEPPSTSNDNCLDFLRFHFTATGTTVDADVCGDADSRPVDTFVQTGFHGVSPLNMEFRSNRIQNSDGFFVAVTCINPIMESRVTRQAGFQQRNDCMPSQSLPVRRLGKKKRSVQPQMDIENVFHVRQERSFRVPWVRVTVTQVLKYVDNTLIVEEKGHTVYKFKGIKVLQVFNRIEGYLTFYGSSTPHGRTFPGYGKLHIGNGIAYCIQTIVDPRFLLSEEEDEIVRQLHSELFLRQAFNNERFYFNPPSPVGDPDINCTINDLAYLNIRSCTAVVRSAADYFLRTDPFRDFCRRSRYPGYPG